LLGRPFGEETLLKIAHAYESGTLWHKENIDPGKLAGGKTNSPDA
jgi:hypothetical protein